MRDTITTCGELCGCVDIDAGDTPADSPVTRLITSGAGLAHASQEASSAPICSAASCCAARCGAG